MRQQPNPKATAAGTQAKKTIIWQSRKAHFDYTFEFELEAGIVLVGTEVKSLRNGHAHLNDGYVMVRGHTAHLVGGHIGEYSYGNTFNHVPNRDRILLLHAREIEKLAQQIKRQGYTAVPLEMYFKGGRVKILLGVGTGKNTIDKRHRIKERDTEREMARSLRQRQR